MKGLLGENKVHVVVKTNLDLPVGQGFGMSAASAVSASYAHVFYESMNQISTKILRIQTIFKERIPPGL